MLKWIKWLFIGVIAIVLIAGATVYVTLSQSLPVLDGQMQISHISHPASLSRDALGQAVITAANQMDAVYLLGYAHGQDRLFQMDLQRRVAAGELSEWLGDVALNVDKNNRFHQFRRRAERILPTLPDWQQQALAQYAKGVNQAISELGAKPFEYILTGFDIKPWTEADSLLVVYSMYLDLQGNTLERDLALTELEKQYGQPIVDFILQSSQYQAALDGSRQQFEAEIPPLPAEALTAQLNTNVLPFNPEVGSNNWIVSGDLTDGGGALLANDMHLGFRVPIIWYRTQLNYARDDYDVNITGVSLPGVPGIIVGTNGHIAWGFTNAYIDTADWVEIRDPASLTEVEETILVKGEAHRYIRLESQWGPVKQIGDRYYALQWVAHQPYSANLNLMQMDTQLSVLQAIPTVRKLGIPVQNFVMGDTGGNIAWMPGGAVPGRQVPKDIAVPESQAASGWDIDEMDLPVVMNPDTKRIWTGNSRVMSADDAKRFGDGGYALGARAQQIRDRLFDYNQFDEGRFYQIQLDNEARFLQPWHALLRQLLNRNSGYFASDINALENWGNCACADSVGYTLVKHFRQQVISAAFNPVADALSAKDLSLRPLSRYLEPAIWQLIRNEPPGWLPKGHDDWQSFMLAQYEAAKASLEADFGKSEDLSSLRWGKVNTLAITHPFAKQIPVLGKYLNMPEVEGFGDTYMPSVQQPAFGASERLFVRPGKLDSAVLTLPGGQSGHPLSPFYRAGFMDYAEQRLTPLLPGTPVHTLSFTPQ
ncbi:penicillin acylase family protein [Aestuariibacter sp. GS-14]|uniref:penicillin acylase family protein n=1 Tax=Aestuariibacter sp. GS-14 TaxID=2590670 RepID=UPI00112A31EB|nr:penicillin acylase family protein [Aestuariibacter sp. GS-14]TPV55361.1 penicillin acylase family protein [Aestuariibacter sp. GS-14]